MSFSRYKMVIDQMVDVGLLPEMPSPVQLRRKYDRETLKMRRSARRMTNNTAFQDIELSTQKEKWIHNMELEVLARRGLQVRPRANRATRAPEPPQQNTDILQQTTDIPQQTTNIPQHSQPPNTPRTLERPRQQREARLDRPREGREELSTASRGQGQARSNRPRQGRDLIPDRPRVPIEEMSNRARWQRQEAPVRPRQRALASNRPRQRREGRPDEPWRRGEVGPGRPRHQRDDRSWQRREVAFDRPRERREERFDRPRQPRDERAVTGIESRADAMQTRTGRPHRRSNQVRREYQRYRPY